MITKDIIINILLVLLTATIFGGGVYLWKQSEINNLSLKFSENSQTIQELKDKIANYQIVDNINQQNNSNNNLPESTSTAKITNPTNKSYTKINNDSTKNNLGKYTKKTDKQLIKEAFATKYNKSINDIMLEITDNNGDYAQGTVKFTGEVAGAWWLAAKPDQKWIIVADGNGVIMCSDIDPYNFPTTMVPECYDASTSQTIHR